MSLTAEFPEVPLILMSSFFDLFLFFLVEFGTPLEDARRRDCTINALYFNLDTMKMEDPTEMGLNDLKSRIVRTPTDPEVTLSEDPLRVLRLIRFASSLDFALDDSICSAFRNKVLLDALKLKVSRERIRIEMDKMMALEKRKCENAVSRILEVDGLMNIVLFDEHQWRTYEALQTPALSARYAFYFVQNGFFGPVDPLMKRLKWPAKRTQTVKNMLRALTRLRQIKDKPKREILLWAGEFEFVYDRVLEMERFFDAAHVDSCTEHLERENVCKRLSTGPLLRGDEIETLANVKNREIGSALRRLREWQMTAPLENLDREHAIQFIATQKSS